MKKILVSSAVLLLSGCSYLTPLTVSTNHLDPDHEISLAIVTGTATNSYVLGLSVNTDEDMQTALERAKAEAGADNLINVVVDRRITYFPFTILPIYTRIETIVRGTAIRYKDPSWRRVKDLTIPAVPPEPAKPVLKATEGAL